MLPWAVPPSKAMVRSVTSVIGTLSEAGRSSLGLCGLVKRERLWFRAFRVLHLIGRCARHASVSAVSAGPCARQSSEHHSERDDARAKAEHQKRPASLRLK